MPTDDERDNEYWENVSSEEGISHSISIIPPGDPDAAFRPREEQRKLVEELVGYSIMTHEQICILIKNPASGKSIRIETLRRCFAEELERGEVAMKANLAHKVFMTAYGCKAEYDNEGNLLRAEQKPNARLLEFLAQSKLNWRPKIVIEDDREPNKEVVSLKNELREMFAQSLEKNKSIMTQTPVGEAVVQAMEKDIKDGE